MTQEDKLLLLKDLCGRLPYGVICHANEINIDGELIFINKLYNIAALYYDNTIGKFEYCPINDIKPYLRPIHKLTKEELEELEFLTDSDYVDYCNKHYIDYRDLILKRLALEAPKGMYK